MNIKEYISSGVVENYVLGLASDAERAEFEAMCHKYPEVVEARTAFETALEQQLMLEAVAPPPLVRQNIEVVLFGDADSQAAAVNTAPVRPIHFWKWMAAAAVVLLAGTLFWAITLNNQYGRLQARVSNLEAQNSQAVAQLNALKADAQKMQSPTVKMAAMQGTAHAPGAFATVYWDTTSKDVYMMINNLPQPASDRQYQLWALINNQPVDLGVFEMRQEKLLVKMKGVQSAQAFAVTLEPRGGSPSPTMEAMYAMGKL